MVPDGDPLDTGADLGHHARPFIAQDGRELDAGQRAVHDVETRMADATRGESDSDLVRPRRLEFDVEDLQWFASTEEDGGAHSIYLS